MKSSIWTLSNAPFSSLCICQERPAAVTNSPKSQELHKRDDFSFMAQGMWVDEGLCSLPLGTQHSRPSGILEFSESSGPQTRERNHMEETCFAHLPQPLTTYWGEQDPPRSKDAENILSLYNREDESTDTVDS